MAGKIHGGLIALAILRQGGKPWPLLDIVKLGDNADLTVFGIHNQMNLFRNTLLNPFTKFSAFLLLAIHTRVNKKDSCHHIEIILCLTYDLPSAPELNCRMSISSLGNNGAKGTW